jgi:hypothetical protein
MHRFGASDDEEGWTKSIDIDVMADGARLACRDPVHRECRWRRDPQHFVDLSLSREHAHGTPFAAVKSGLINYTMSQALALASKKMRHRG